MSNENTGHSKNLTNFQRLIYAFAEMGAEYNPAREILAVAAMTVLYLRGREALDNLEKGKQANRKNINARKDVSKRIKAFSTKAFHALKTFGLVQNTIENARSFYMRIQGRRINSLKEEPAVAPAVTEDQPQEPKKKKSVAQQNYDALIENFGKFVIFLQNEPLYVPNEEEVKTTTLAALLEEARAINMALAVTENIMDSNFITRKEIFYADKDSIVEVTKAAKLYARSKFGTKSDRYRRVSKIYIKKLK